MKDLAFTDVEPTMLACEREGYWSTLAARHLTHGRTSWVPSLALLSARLEQELIPAVAVTLDERWWRDLPQWMVGMRRQWPDLVIVVISTLDLRELAPRFLELGAHAVVHSSLELPTAIRIVNRRFAQFTGPALSLEERIWNNLPWNDSLSARFPAAEI